MGNTVIQKVKDEKLIAILRGISSEQCLPVAQALTDGGITLMELPFNQKDPASFADTAKAISKIREHFSGKVEVGAGTVLTPAQVDLAADAGAGYMISPDTKPDVIERTLQRGRVSIPGALTPSEITLAASCGADFVKLFPAGTLGVDYIKAVAAPLNHLPFLGVGGVNPENIPALLKAGCLGFGIGGNLVNRAWIEAGDYKKLTETAKAFCRAVGR